LLPLRIPLSPQTSVHLLKAAEPADAIGWAVKVVELVALTSGVVRVADPVEAVTVAIAPAVVRVADPAEVATVAIAPAVVGAADPVEAATVAIAPAVAASNTRRKS